METQNLRVDRTSLVPLQGSVGTLAPPSDDPLRNEYPHTLELPPSVSIVKRALDLLLAGSGLLLTAPIFPLLALVIYIDSPGPIFYRQRRAWGVKFSKRSRRTATQPSFYEFKMLKFRTMVPNAERLTGAVLADENDPRITRVGRWLRKTRLDELPQLINVLRGEMSMVGPRPERPELFADLIRAIPFFEERVRGLKPGITGYAQVSLGYLGQPLPGSEVEPYARQLTNPFSLDGTEGATADEMRMKLLYDLAYAAAAENFWTFLRLEVYIIFKTPLVMLRGVGR